MACDRRRIFACGGGFGWLTASGLALALLAAAGLVLLLAPGAARRLSEAQEAASRYPADDKVTMESGDKTLAAIGPVATAAQVEENRRRWAGLKESERAALLRRLERLEQLTAEERGLLAGRYAELEKLPENERQELRRQAEALARFEGTLGRQDLAALEGLEAKARARYLAELWRMRQGQR